MAFNKVNFSKVSDKDLEELYNIEIEFRSSNGDSMGTDSFIYKKFLNFYTNVIGPATNEVYYDMEDLENEIKIRRREKIINQLL